MAAADSRMGQLLPMAKVMSMYHTAAIASEMTPVHHVTTTMGSTMTAKNIKMILTMKTKRTNKIAATHLYRTAVGSSRVFGPAARTASPPTSREAMAQGSKRGVMREDDTENLDDADRRWREDYHARNTKTGHDDTYISKQSGRRIFRSTIDGQTQERGK